MYTPQSKVYVLHKIPFAFLHFIDLTISLDPKHQSLLLIYDEYILLSGECSSNDIRTNTQ